MLGHPSPALLYSTYRELVALEEAKAFWNIVPDSVERERKAREGAEKARQKRELLERDAEEKVWAEAESNCGRAFKDESGHWCPVMDERVDSSARIREALGV